MRQGEYTLNNQSTEVYSRENVALLVRVGAEARDLVVEVRREVHTLAGAGVGDVDAVFLPVGRRAEISERFFSCSLV